MNPNPPRKLLDQVQDTIRLCHYSIRTEEAYINWIRRFILFHEKRHPQDMGRAEIEAFLKSFVFEPLGFWSAGCHFFLPTGQALH